MYDVDDTGGPRDYTAKEKKSLIKTIEHSRELVVDIYNSVVRGERTEDDLRRCSCPSCKRALKLMKGEN
ncbi:MAG: hypothetical protein IMZ64_08665 [Bacteroidetes bacterium]|nr:hypothetical protein [Bacteroidota bacterium]